MNPITQAIKERINCSCERCGRFCKLFQYTKFEVKEVSYKSSYKNKKTGEIVYVAHRNDMGEKRGLCEDCAVEINKRNYDAKTNTQPYA